MDQNKIGEFIAKCRKEYNMTQMQFAEKLGVTNKAVSKWETGKCLPDAALFGDICMLLNITLNELFAGERIAPESIEKKSEENLIEIATELQKKDHKIVLLKYFTAIIALVASATSISVGGISFEGTPRLFKLITNYLSNLHMGSTYVFHSKR
ncbi:MAG: helix-turn-helix domain-containing protein [Anaerobutyricum sp.]